MEVVAGMHRGRIRTGKSPKLTTDKIHAVKEGYTTECGINFEKSEILGVAREGSKHEVNCKRCLQRIN